MAKRLGLVLMLAAAVAVVTAPAMGQVTLKVNDGPIQVIDSSGSDVVNKPRDLFENLPTTEGIPPATTTWFLPRFRVDTTDFSDTTLWSARHNGNGTIGLQVGYLNSSGVLQTSSQFTLAEREVVSVNIRDIPNLATTPSGVALGT